jgi:branched-chain amino acid aminotransferase
LDTYINLNGKIIRSDQPVVHANNRGFRYGDGIFETIRVKEGHIILADYHFDRLFSGIESLQFELPLNFTKDRLALQIEELCKKNHEQRSARVRLMVYRSDDGLSQSHEDFPDYIIQSSSIASVNPVIDEQGLQLAVYPHGKKAIDLFSNLKSNNYLLPVMAGKYAKSHQCGDCLILNSKENICESTMANIFCVKNKKIYTPPLSEGCVAGVTRRYLIEQMTKGNYPQEETAMDIEFLKNSDEIFLSNAIQGIRWVSHFRDRKFGNTIASQLYRSFIGHFF